MKHLYEEEEPKWITIKPSREDKWSACLQTLEGHSALVWSLAFSPDSARLASGSDDCTVKIWDASSNECLQTLEGHSSPVRSVTFSPDSAWLASGSDDGTVKIWDASSGDCLQTLNTSEKLFKLSFDTTGSYLYAGFSTIAISKLLPLRALRSVTDSNIPQHHGALLSSDQTWITYNSENLIWLPSEYRPSCFTVSGKTISIGTGSGKIWIYCFQTDYY